MICTQLPRDVGGFDPSYRFAEERDLSVQFRERGCTSRSSRSSLFHRFHGLNVNLRMRTQKHPLPRSLKAKLDRERASGGDTRRRRLE
jgi:hypothetical protein